ncbi:hypothetical protein A9239_09645 [Methanosarcina sp. A14]|uniref:Uncharacterized protein n=1 Tax=Methanosarcina barkeri MS TaxID=1434108 RepID=A0A0E3QT37_METBA|nr:hypothetical protein [Methanosarcina barkeri]AKB54495.1 hypothetical protein MSBRM_1497 [Methanosarcina barkeri MS]OED07923.1 hypothetical protein A9239_09645 [Methanosarcina sp. A14]
MEKITCDKIHREHTLIRVLGITSLTILILAGVASAAPFAYVTNLGDLGLTQLKCRKLDIFINILMA